MPELSLSQLALIRGDRRGHLVVAGTSMFPLLRPGDRVAIRPVDRVPRIGDVVLVRAAERLVLHRVVARRDEARSIVTRGDSNRWPDPPIATSQVLGHLEGLYDPASRSCRRFSTCRRVWDRWFRFLVRVELSGFCPAFVAACACAFARRSLAAIRTDRRP